MKKPEIGKYHVVSLICCNLQLNIFGEYFSVPPETMLEYVVATIDVKKQKLELFLDKKQVESIINCDKAVECYRCPGTQHLVN